MIIVIEPANLLQCSNQLRYRGPARVWTYRELLIAEQCNSRFSPRSKVIVLGGLSWNTNQLLACFPLSSVLTKKHLELVTLRGGLYGAGPVKTRFSLALTFYSNSENIRHHFLSYPSRHCFLLNNTSDSFLIEEINILLFKNTEYKRSIGSNPHSLARFYVEIFNWVFVTVSPFVKCTRNHPRRVRVASESCWLSNFHIHCDWSRRMWV